MKAFAFYIVGLIVTMGSVGGVEQSVTTTALVQSCALSLVGIALMIVGVSYAKESERPKHNPTLW